MENYSLNGDNLFIIFPDTCGMLESEVSAV